MKTTELTCIQCPMGCSLTVTVDGENVTVSGNTCPRGEIYGKKEVTAPTRTVTSTVADVMKAIRALRVQAPVHIGDVLIENAADSGSDIVATKNVEAV